MPLFVNNLFQINSAVFNQAALELFSFQYKNNAVYGGFVQALNKPVGSIQTIERIPFLPISFFKTHAVKTTAFEEEQLFESSGTTQTVQSKHLVKSLKLYEDSFFNAFALQYGFVKDYCVLGLLPSYLERKHSSLVYMVQRMMDESGHPLNGFFLSNVDELAKRLIELEEQQQKTLLIGVTFGLLDFAEQYQLPLKHTIVMETGGMKGRREELTRDEVHAQLKKSFLVDKIHSEYGMTELLSQAYSKGDGIFYCPPWMKVLVREEDDPMQLKTKGKGALNIIDLANVYSCSFIATDDIGEVFEDGSFRVMGRIDNSDIRGCSLLAL
ncbi:acyl transferase [Lacibacter luteus]|uniref:Acyl transferase n=1 Tax=Lacibacter luteus TaxID=2508719 RepID=A0A4Q1CP25_9BACT|nr:acyl transferase [Lacibacter luteus]